MKTVTLKAICATSLVALVLPVAATQADIENFKKEFAGVRALDLPARAASTVTGTTTSDRNELATDVVNAAVSVNPSAAPMVVGAVAGANAGLAPVSAVAAASAQPKQISRITKAAVGAAPSETIAIVSALMKSHPGEFYRIGVSAAEVSPKSSEAIVNAISAASPTVKTLIAKSDKGQTKISNPSDVAKVLRSADALLVALSKSSRTPIETLAASELSAANTAKLTTLAESFVPPTIGGPYTPGAGTPGELNTAQTYSAPQNPVRPSDP